MNSSMWAAERLVMSFRMSAAGEPVNASQPACSIERPRTGGLVHLLPHLAAKDALLLVLAQLLGPGVLGPAGLTVLVDVTEAGHHGLAVRR